MVTLDKLNLGSNNKRNKIHDDHINYRNEGLNDINTDSKNDETTMFHQNSNIGPNN